MTPLSWQPPPVTKCGECLYEAEYLGGSIRCQLDGSKETYHQNKNGITQSCPMWQQQNKDKL